MRGFRFIPDNINIDFMGKRRYAYVFSIILLLGSIFLISTKGLNFGVDFAGGIMLEIKTPEAQPDLNVLRTDLNGLELGSVSIQEFGAPDDLLIRLPQQGDSPDAQKAAIAKVTAALDTQFGEGKTEFRRSEYVGPQVGKELKVQGLYAILITLLGILVYIWARFEWQYGVAAILTLIAHDVIVVIGLFALTQLEFNLSTVAAVLLVAGYSINDTVIVFDRIREEIRRYKKMPIDELMNMALNKTLARTTMTSLTTLLALVALYVFGGPVIQDFIYALIFGIAIGTYSSIYVASPLLMALRVKRGGEGGASQEAAV